MLQDYVELKENQRWAIPTLELPVRQMSTKLFKEDTRSFPIVQAELLV